MSKRRQPGGRRITRTEERRLLIEAVAAELRRWRYSPFEFESACRHALRARLCLEGWSWAKADAYAAEIVAAALARNGARRPSWKQGQPEWTQEGHTPIERTRCVRCAGKLPEGHHKWCSRECAAASQSEIARTDRAEEVRIQHELAIKAWRAKQDWRECPACGTAWKPKRHNQLNQIHCSRECANLNRGPSRFGDLVSRGARRVA